MAKFFYRNNILQIIYNDGYIDLHERLDMIKTSLNYYSFYYIDQSYTSVYNFFARHGVLSNRGGKKQSDYVRIDSVQEKYKPRTPREPYL